MSNVMEKVKTLLTTLKGTAVTYTSPALVSAEQYKGRQVEITKKFTFEAGHFVPEHPGRCKYVHGHSYKLFVTLSGPINDQGVVMDFNDLNKIVEPLIDEFDHGFLNDTYERPTAEIMAAHILDAIELKLFGTQVHCEKVELYETEKCSATVYRFPRIFGVDLAPNAEV